MVWANLERPSRRGPLADIGIVAAASLVTFAIEDRALANGWISAGTRGAFTVVVGAGAALALVRMRGRTLADLGLRRPDRWATVPLWVTGILAVFVAAQLLAPILVSSFVALPEPDWSRHEVIAGDLSAALAMALILPLTASIPEEIVFRGFLIRRLEVLLGSGTRGAVLAVVVQALMFASAHFQWGIGGMVMATFMGLIWGTAYLLCGRNLWIPILAHSGGHILFVVHLYLSEPV